MHTTLIVINDLDDGYKPTPDDICQYWDFDRYIDYVMEFDDEVMRRKELKISHYSLLGQEVKVDGTFRFNKPAFRKALISSAYEFGLLDGRHKAFHDLCLIFYLFCLSFLLGNVNQFRQNHFLCNCPMLIDCSYPCHLIFLFIRQRLFFL